MRDDRVEEPPPEREPGLFEVLGKYRRVQEDRAKIEAWDPRGKEKLAEVPRNGPPEAYAAGTPERAVAEFMHLWERQNFGHMARLVPGPLYEKPSSKELGKIAGELRKIYESKKLLAFEISEIEDEAAAITNVKVEVRFEQEQQIIEKTLDLRLLYLDDEGSPTYRSSSEGSWKIQNLWLAIY